LKPSWPEEKGERNVGPKSNLEKIARRVRSRKATFDAKKKNIVQSKQVRQHV